MDLERIQYRIYKRLPIIIIVALALIAIILVIIGQVKGSRDRPDTEGPTVQISVTQSPNSNSNALKGTNLLTYLEENCVLVEVAYTDNWTGSFRYERYYDYLENAYALYKVTFTDNDIQYEQLTGQQGFSGELERLTDIPTILPTEHSNTNIYMLDTNFYSLENEYDAYKWLAQLKNEGKTLNTVIITADYLDVYFTDSGKSKRAVITDRYILVNDYIGEVPTY